MVGRRLLTVLILATATTALAAVPAPVCPTTRGAEHACCRAHGEQVPATQGAACHRDGSSAPDLAASFACHCAHEPAAPAEQTTVPAPVQPSTYGVHAAPQVLAGAPASVRPAAAQPPVHEAAGPPLFSLTCALLI